MSITAETLYALAQSPPTNASSRRALYNAAKHLMHSLERQSDTETRIMDSHLALPLARIGVDINLFSTLAAEPSKPWTVSELATKTGLEPLFLHRLLRGFASQVFISEIDADVFQANHITPTFLPQGFRSTLEHSALFITPPAHAFPEWLKRNGYREPTGSRDCAFQSALGTEDDIMGYFQAHPEKAQYTFETMAWQQLKSGTWFDGSVDVEELQLSPQDLDAGRTLLVDVGGGSGHQCFAFRKAFPERIGKMVLQDIPVMISMVDHAAAAAIDLEPMAHDFTTPQPSSTRGANAYYMRTILHDWNDAKCSIILSHLRDAMADDSYVVLDEIVVPPKGADAALVLYDLTMMVALGARERSESQWRNLLGGAGLRVERLVEYDDQLHASLIFARKA